MGMTSAHQLFHGWMKKFGSCVAEHESEIIKDINQFESDLTAALHMQVQIEDTIRKKAHNDAIEKATKLALDHTVESMEQDEPAEEWLAAKIRALKE